MSGSAVADHRSDDASLASAQAFQFSMAVWCAVSVAVDLQQLCNCNTIPISDVLRAAAASYSTSSPASATASARRRQRQRAHQNAAAVCSVFGSAIFLQRQASSQRHCAACFIHSSDLSNFSDDDSAARAAAAASRSSVTAPALRASSAEVIFSPSSVSYCAACVIRSGSLTCIM